MKYPISRKPALNQLLFILSLILFSGFGFTQEDTFGLLEDIEVSGVINAEGGRLKLEDGTYVEFKPSTFISDTSITVSTSTTESEIPEDSGALSKLFGMPASNEQILEQKFVDITRYTTISISSTDFTSGLELSEDANFNVHLPVSRSYAYHNSALALVYIFSDEDYVGSTLRQYRNLPPTEESVSRLINILLWDAATLSPPQSSMSVIIIVKGLKDPPPPRDVEREREDY